MRTDEALQAELEALTAEQRQILYIVALSRAIVTRRSLDRVLGRDNSQPLRTLVQHRLIERHYAGFICNSADVVYGVVRNLRGSEETAKLARQVERVCGLGGPPPDERQLLLGLVSGNAAYLEQGLSSSAGGRLFALLVGYPLETHWFERYPDLVDPLWLSLVEARFRALEPIDDILAYDAERGGLSPAVRAMLDLKRGDSPDSTSLAAVAASSVLRGEVREGLKVLDAELTAWRKRERARKIFWADDLGALHLFGRLRDGRKSNLRRVSADAKIAAESSSGRERALWDVFAAAELRRTGATQQAASVARRAASDLTELLAAFAPHGAYLAVLLTEFDVDLEPYAPALTVLRDRAVRVGWITVAVAADRALRLTSQFESHPILERHPANAEITLFDVERQNDAWRFELEALAEACSTHAVERDKRLAWMLHVEDGTVVEIAALEQKRSTRGWTKGREIPLHRVGVDPAVDYLTDHDRRVMGAFKQENYRSSRRAYDWDDISLLQAVVGHPALVNLAREPLEVVGREVAVEVVRQRGDYRVGFGDWVSEPIAVESPNRISVALIGPVHRKMESLLRRGIRVPADEWDELSPVLAALSSHVRIDSDRNLELATDVQADARIYARFWRSEDQIQLELRARPAGPDGTLCIPGRGSASMLTNAGGTSVQVSRDLAVEAANADVVIGASPLLMETGGNPEYRFYVGETTDCLHVLCDLARLGDDVTIEWAKGTALPTPKSYGASDVKVSVRAADQWFEADAELRVSEERTLALSELIDLASTQRGEFVQLTTGQVLRLSTDLRRRLETLDLLSQGRKSGKPLKLPAGAASAIWDAVDLMPGAGRARKLSELARGLDLPLDESLEPAKFNGTLRAYQRFGYAWLRRLAGLGFGACLADEMGLGKTIQALALLGDLAADGPSLVVAPTSVCGNWGDETVRFAPSLTPVFPAPPAERAAQVAGLQPGDLYIISYTMLGLLEESLGDVEWAAVVLDEAHAIKNRGTQRAQAAKALRANVRLAITGTPVENHVGELWSLMDFLNPGLLGSHKQFTTRYGPSLDPGDSARRRAVLRRLVQPFILRRRKADVFDELPPKQEITLRVEMGDEQASLYEATRRAALEALEDGGDETRFHVLAGLTKLRQVACDARLVMPESPVVGSKVERLLELVEELREGGNRALVFSQFTSLLALVREALDEANIPYEYLDGATPAAQRPDVVERFQSGDAPVFLVSLRAGGTGLNLTAANYVIHLDPWWNPAVEDQASDRSHRIGQRRKVTVYRMIAAHTLEESIVELHANKREIADDLLEGTETATKLSLAEMVELLRS